MAGMTVHTANKAPSTSEIHHALLRPVILQILRAQGYYSSTPRTIDTLTELTGNYITAISRQVVYHAADNNPDSLEPSIIDVRMALEDCGALPASQDLDMAMMKEDDEEEDTHAVDDFISWATGKKNQRIRKIAGLVTLASTQVGETGEEVEVEERPTDYLSALKKKHNKTDQDSKYAGTILGKSIDHGEVPVEGGPIDSLFAWEQMMRNRASSSADSDAGDDDDDDDDRGSRAPSSGLSSLDEGDVEMYDMKD